MEITSAAIHKPAINLPFRAELGRSTRNMLRGNNRRTRLFQYETCTKLSAGKIAFAEGENFTSSKQPIAMMTGDRLDDLARIFFDVRRRKTATSGMGRPSNSRAPTTL
jgi:hypothetical protein